MRSQSLGGTTEISSSFRDGICVVSMDNADLHVEVAPEIGGRVISLFHRRCGREFLWRNPKLALRRNPPGAEYDPNFYGGMDELIPNDIPERIDGISYPDHGEFWTLPLTAKMQDGTLTLLGGLPRAGLKYERRMRLDGEQLICDYRISNGSGETRNFMWKLHAALAVQAGDRVRCEAETAQVVDPAWSRSQSPTPFPWPFAAGMDMSKVPVQDGSGDFLYLYGLREGRIALETVDQAKIECAFDPKVFPCCWYFASYGKMDGAFVGILEPCTNMPISVNDAAHNGICASLSAGETLETTVIWTATAKFGDAQ